jgi:uncharacterized protein (TIGR00299 family) protein
MHVHVEPFCGASGDMLLGALVDAGVPLVTLQAAIDALAVGDLRLSRRAVDQHGIAATKVDVEGTDDHHHRHLPDIERIIDGADLDATVKARAVAVFRALAAAEARVHDMPVEQVHFHEVGALDAIADVVATVAGLHHLGATSVSCRAVPLSHGTVRCAHGLLPVPAPAVLRLVEGLPTQPLDVDGETVTPTAAALLRVLVTDWTAPPPMTLRAHGYGAGTKQFPRANVLRLTLGEPTRHDHAAPGSATLTLLETNLDDMNPEWLPPLLERLLAAGARDAWLTPALMKKGRPAQVLSVLCDPIGADGLRQLMFQHTTSLGIRESTVARHHLARRSETVETPFGPVAVKVAELPDGTRRAAPEFEDCSRLAVDHGIPVQHVHDAALLAWRAGAAGR